MENSKNKLTCRHCLSDFFVPNSRVTTAKYCSRKCSDSHPRKHHVVRCRECASMFPRKKSASDRNKTWGNFCSANCISNFKKRTYSGAGNPNHKGRNFDSDGYRLYTPQASTKLGMGKIKLHHAVAFLAVGITKLPKGMHVHHKNCNVLDNRPENLQLMTISDHKWIHKQYGVATLSAVESGAADVREISLWSDDPIRAESLLIGNVLTQGSIMKLLKEKTGMDADIAKISALKGVRLELVEVDELTDTERGTGGFGSTGA